LDGTLQRRAVKRCSTSTARCQPYRKRPTQRSKIKTREVMVIFLKPTMKLREPSAIFVMPPTCLQSADLIVLVLVLVLDAILIIEDEHESEDKQERYQNACLYIISISFPTPATPTIRIPEPKR
jgi:hypothetical protein